MEVNALGTQTRRYYDTFDWRLFKHHRTLCQVDDTVSLWTLDNRPIGERTPLIALPPFVADWPDSLLKAELSRFVSIRALMERVMVHASYIAISEQAAPYRPVMNIVFEEPACKSPRTGRTSPYPD